MDAPREGKNLRIQKLLAKLQHMDHPSSVSHLYLCLSSTLLSLSLPLCVSVYPSCPHLPLIYLQFSLWGDGHTLFHTIKLQLWAQFFLEFYESSRQILRHGKFNINQEFVSSGQNCRPPVCPKNLKWNFGGERLVPHLQCIKQKRRKSHKEKAGILFCHTTYGSFIRVQLASLICKCDKVNHKPHGYRVNIRWLRSWEGLILNSNITTHEYSSELRSSVISFHLPKL